MVFPLGAFILQYHNWWGEFFKWRKEEDYADDWQVVTILTNEPEPTPYVIHNPYAHEQEKELTAARYDAFGSPTKKQMAAPEAQPVRSTPKIGRNEPCACGSGRKFKKCCLNDEQERGN